MTKDYTSICSCGHEEYNITLKQVKIDANVHINKCIFPDPEVFVDRNLDGEIDDTFQTLIIARK